MAQNTTYEATQAWLLVTDSDVTAVSFQNRSNYPLEVYATVGTGTPAASVQGIMYPKHQGERNANLSDLFPGISGANRIWVRGNGQMWISHA